MLSRVFGIVKLNVPRWRAHRRSGRHFIASSGLLGVVTVTVVVASGCGSSGTGSAGASAGPTPATVAMSIPGFDVSTFNYAAGPEYLGYWKKQGLSVNVVPSQSSASAITLLLAGKADIAAVGTSSVLAALSSAPSLRIVYYYITGNIARMVTLPSSPISSLAGLKGKTVGTFAPTGALLDYFKAEVSAAGVNPSTVKWVPTGTGAVPMQQLKSGTIAAYGSYDSQTADMEAQLGQPLKILASPYDSEIQGFSSIVTTTKILQTKRAVVVGLLRGIAEATRYEIKNPVSATRINFKQYPSSIPTGESLSEATTQAVPEVKARTANSTQLAGKWGWVSTSAINFYTKFLAETKVIPAFVPASKFVDLSLIPDVNKI